MKWLSKSFLLSLCISIVFSGMLFPYSTPETVHASEAVIPVANFGFEDGAAGTVIPDWTSLFSAGEQHYYTVTDELSFAGSNSLKIVDQKRDASVALNSQLTEITPGVMYRATAQIYAEENSTASISLLYYDENQEKINMTEIVVHNETSKGFPVQKWTKGATPAVQAPASARFAQIQLSTTRYAIATAYYDNAAIEAVEPEEPVSYDLRNPGFDKGMVNGTFPYWSNISSSTGNDHYAELSDETFSSPPYSLKIKDQARDKSIIILSDPVEVLPGDFYTGAGKLYLKENSTGSISIRFYNASGQQLNVGSPEQHYETGKGFPIEQWRDITTHQVTAPDEAAYARLLVYTTSYAIAEAYFDDLQIRHEPDLTPARLLLTAPATLSTDQQITVSLSASRLRSLQTLDANLYYDQQLLEYTGTTPANVFTDTGASFTAENNAGNIHILASTIENQPITENGELVQLQFKVIGDTGQAWITIGTDTWMNQQYALPFSQTTLSNIGNAGVSILENKLFGSLEDLGAPIADTVGLFNGKAGQEDGVNVMYTTVKGIPPMFYVINLDNNTIIRSLEMTGGSDVWSHIIAPNGDVYMASGGELWRYSPVTKQVAKVLSYSGENVFWTLTHDEAGNIYIATGPNGKILQYNPVTGTINDYGRLMGHIDQEYVRSIAYSNGYVYGGTSLGEIYKVNTETGAKEEIAAPLQEAGYVYDLDIIDERYLIARYDTSQIRYVYDLEEHIWLDINIKNSSSGLHLAKTSRNGKVYMPVGGQIKALDLTTMQIEELGVPFGTGFRGADWVQSNDPELPGESLVTMNFGGGYTYFNPTTKKVKTVANFLPPSPSITHKFAMGHNGKLYITGMQASKAAEYDIFSSQNKLIPMGQAGSITSYQDKVYFGVYPQGDFEVYEPAGNANPTRLFSIGNEQDRPLNSIEADGKIYVATIPDYLKLGGALMVFDPAGAVPAQSFQVYRNIVKDQSIISLAHKDGKIYGSTNINGGLSSQTVADEAKLFAWDIATKTKQSEISLSIPGLIKPPSIGGLSIGPDGLLWGGVNGYVFALDPASMQLVKYKNLYPEDGAWGHWGAFNAAWSDGVLYMQLGRRIAAIDPATLEHRHLADSESFTIGEDGHLYFSPHPGVTSNSNRTLMYRMKIKDKMHPGKLNASAPLRVENGEEFEVSIYANQVVDLNELQAVISYDQSKLELISSNPAGPFTEANSEFNWEENGGVITVSAALSGDDTISDDAKVIILRFKAVNAANSTNLSILQQSISFFADGSVPYPMSSDKQISIRITPKQTTPVNPGSNHSGLITLEPPVEHEDILTVSATDLKKNADSPSAIIVPAGIGEVRLPAHAAEMIGAQSVTLTSAQLHITLTPEVLQQLQSLIPENQERDAQISFQFHPVPKEVQQQFVQAAKARYGANISTASEVFTLHIDILFKNGTKLAVPTLDKPLVLNLYWQEGATINNSADLSSQQKYTSALLGTYQINQDGIMSYMPSELTDSHVTLPINQLGQYGIFLWDKSFSDISQGHWAEAAIKKMAARQVVHGLSKTEFAPNKSITRAEFTSWIVRAWGLSTTQANNQQIANFKDIPSQAWYTASIAAAFDAGIVRGRSTDRFAPTETITREEMAVILMRAYQQLQSRDAVATTSQPAFNDQLQISPWAIASVDLAQQLGFIKGRSNHHFAPKAVLTRAEAIQAIANMLD